MRKLVVLGAILIVLGVVADIGAKALSESQIEQTAHREVPESSTDAAIPVFPFLPPLLLAGKVDEVSVRLTRVPVQGGVMFDKLDFDLRGVEISRRALLNERRVQLVKIDRGTVTALVALPEIVRALPIEGLSARVVDRSIVLQGPGGVSVRIPMPTEDLIPCDGTATVVGGRVRISCTLEEIPPALVEAVNNA